MNHPRAEGTEWLSVKRNGPESVAFISVRNNKSLYLSPFSHLERIWNSQACTCFEDLTLVCPWYRDKVALGVSLSPEVSQVQSPLLLVPELGSVLFCPSFLLLPSRLSDGLGLNLLLEAVLVLACSRQRSGFLCKLLVYVRVRRVGS